MLGAMLLRLVPASYAAQRGRETQLHEVGTKAKEEGHHECHVMMGRREQRSVASMLGCKPTAWSERLAAAPRTRSPRYEEARRRSGVAAPIARAQAIVSPCLGRLSQGRPLKHTAATRHCRAGWRLRCLPSDGPREATVQARHSSPRQACHPPLPSPGLRTSSVHSQAVPQH